MPTIAPYPMDTASIELPGTQIESISLTEGKLRLHFPKARIIKTMTGSTDRTLWWQAGDLVIDGAQLPGPLPVTPIVCAGGDIDANLYTYRDMIPLPLSTRGRVGCELKLSDGSRFQASGDAIHLEMQGIAKYVEHIRTNAA